MALLQIHIDDNLASQAREVAEGMELDLSSAVRLFLRQMVTDNGLPFRPTRAPFYSQSNMDALHRSPAQLKEGNTVSFSFEELETQ